MITPSKVLILSTSIFILSFLMPLSVRSQNLNAFKISLAYGTLNLGEALNVADPDQSTFYGPYFLKVEFPTRKKISMGFVLGYFDNQYTGETTHYIYQDSTWIPVPQMLHNSVRAYTILFRMNYNFRIAENLSGFVGLGGGIDYKRWDIDPDYPLCGCSDDNYLPQNNFYYNIPIMFEGTVGVRYYIIPVIAVFAEMGYSRSALQGGFTISL